MARIVELSQIPSNPYGEHYTEEDNTNIRRLIAEHQTTVHVLNSELERLSHLIERGKSALVPHSRLPLEIIGEIIWYASCSTITIPFEWKYIVTPMRTRRNRIIQPTQVILAQVCSAWRKVAFSIPQLWSFFKIDGCLTNFTLKIALELFSRARGSPIRLTTSMYSELSPQAFQALITSMSHQFSELKLTLSEGHLLQFYQFPTEACANLEVISFRVSYLKALDEMSIDFHPNKYPRLKYLTICRKGPVLRISVIPWRQLTTPRLERIYSSQLNTLRQCVSLEECEIGIEWDSMDDVGEIHLPCLLRFHVRKCPGNLSLFRVFRFPNLEEFEGSRNKFSVDDQDLTLEHFNLPRIRVLRIWDRRKPLDFGALFKLAPSLESVTLSEPEDGPSMHELATGALGPSLHSIEASYTCTCEQALAFAETRWECVDASNASGLPAKIVPFK